MKKFIVCFFAVVLLLSSVAFAVDSDTQATSLQAGWGTTSTVSYPSGYGTSWFYLMLYRLNAMLPANSPLKSGWSDSASGYASGYAGSWYWQVQNYLRKISNASGNDYSLVLSGISSNVGDIKTSNANLLTYLTTVSGNVSSIKSNSDNINTDVHTIQTNSNSILSTLSGIGTNTGALYSESVSQGVTLDSMSDDMSTIDSNLGILKDFFAGERERQLHNAGQASITQATDLYNNNAGGSSAAQKIGDLNGFSSSVGSNFSTGVSAGQVFDIMSSGSDGQGGSVFGFFSQECLDNLDEVEVFQASQGGSGNRNLFKKSSGNDQVVDYFHQQQYVFESMVGGFDCD